MQPSSAIDIACVQTRPCFGSVDRNVEATIRWVHEACGSHARLIVFPELCNTGYAFDSRAELASMAEPWPDGTSLRRWTEAAREHGMHIVAGYAESDADRVYNAAAIVGPDGPVGSYRKAHLSDREKDLFDPGGDGFPVFETDLGRLSVLICYDLWFPEAVRQCATGGAEIICVPTNWSDLPHQPADGWCMGLHLLMAHAHCNGVFIACANRVGTERGLSFNGQSMIVDKLGWPISGPMDRNEEGLLLGRCEPRRARDKYVSERNSVVADRRLDLYS